MARVRSAREDDLAEIVAILRHLRPGLPAAPVSRAALDAWASIGRQDGHEVLVAESVPGVERPGGSGSGHDLGRSGRIVGCLHLLMVPSLLGEADPWALIENIAVDPRWRRLGVGTLLLNASAERAAAAGCYRIHAVSSPENAVAHRMFRAAGYAVEAKAFRRYLKG